MQPSGRLLIVSYGPLPTPEQSKVEGGGLRCWGLACGLRRNLPDLEITLAYGVAFKKPGATSEHDGFPITTWDPGTLSELVSHFDAVLVSYCMGDASVQIAEALRLDQQLILDCYVPIYVEVSARDSADLSREFLSFRDDAKIWTRPLHRGDLFLCANSAQARFYQGVLSGIGRINPLTYNQPMILNVPYGIYRDEPITTCRPISKLVGEEPCRKVLWFGGIYPWFDLRNLIQAVSLANQELPIKLIIVGARNPFNTHPDFVAKYHQIEEFASRPENRSFVVMHDWVPFQERADWYLDSDVVVMVNKPGDENELSWRTRLADFTWAGVPVLTNGGDPLGEELIAAGAAARFQGLSPNAMAASLIETLSDEPGQDRIRQNLKSFRRRLFWDVATKPLAEAIQKIQLAPDLRFETPPPPLRTQPSNPSRPSKVRRLLHLSRRTLVHVRTHGIRRTAERVHARVARRFVRSFGRAAVRGPRILVLCHKLDLTDASCVLLDLLGEMVRRGLRESVDLHTYAPLGDEELGKLNAMGIRPNFLATPDLAPQFVEGDVLILNSVNLSQPVRDAVYTALQGGTIARVIWYVHEDDPETHFTFLETLKIRGLIETDRMSLFARTRQLGERYRRHFKAEILVEPQHFSRSVTPHISRDPADFETLRFVLPGPIADGRKGSLPILDAFSVLLERRCRQNPEDYREFTLTYLGVEDDFLSRQIKNHASVLGERLLSHPNPGREQYLDILRSSNVTICDSLSECMPDFVSEGMVAGHAILRNDGSGIDEQLKDGENGFKLETRDFWQVVDVLERMLNRTKTTNEQLAAMSARSQAIALGFKSNDYRQLIGMAKMAFHPSSHDSHRPHFNVEARAGSSSIATHAGR